MKTLSLVGAHELAGRWTAVGPVLSAVLCVAAASAQSQLPPTYHVAALNSLLAVETQSEQPGFHVLAAAPAPAAVPTVGGLILDGAVILGVMVAPDGNSLFAFNITSPATLGISAQVVAVDAQEFRAGPIMELGVLFGKAPFDDGDAPEPPFEDTMQYLADTKVVVSESDDPRVLKLEYIANSDGYALRQAAVVRHGDRTDVYFVLKTPGPGEGMLDVVEVHSLAVDLGNDPGQRVVVRGIVGADAMGRPLADYLHRASLPLQ